MIFNECYTCIHATCLIFVPKSSNGFVKNWEPNHQHVNSSGRQNSVIWKVIGISGWYPCHQNMDDFPKIAGNLFANKSLLFLWILLLLPMSSQKFPYLPVVRNFFSGEWWWFSLAIGPMDHARENGARETPRGWQRSCHSLVPKRLILFNGKRMWNICSGTKTEPWHFTPLQSGGN